MAEQFGFAFHIRVSVTRVRQETLPLLIWQDGNCGLLI
jgi:hypothetical protein